VHGGGDGGGGGGGGRRRRTPPAPTPAPGPTPAPTLTQEAVEDAAAKISELLDSQSGQDRENTFGGIVRLAFHDAGSFDGSSGGADGCVDVNSDGNKGLDEVITQLTPAVNEVSGRLSRGDVWALAANMVIELASNSAIQLDYQIGRVDASDCTGHGDRHPDAEGDHSDIRDVMVTRLGFTERETAALLGAHVLGRATLSNSGYDGPWVPNSDRFNNRYYQDLLNRPWDKEVASVEGKTRTTWDGPGNRIMLNTDMEIAFDTSSGCVRAGGGGRRRRNGCPRATHDFSNAVTEFAQRGGMNGGMGVWFHAFAPAFKKLMALGNSNLECAYTDSVRNCRTPSS